MLHTDKAMFALLLLRIYLRTCTGESSYESQFDHLLLKADLFITDAPKTALSTAASTKIAGLDEKNVLSLMALSKLDGFKNCINACSTQSNLQNFMTSDKPETDVPQIWEDDQSLSKEIIYLTLKILKFSSNWSSTQRITCYSCTPF